MPTFNAGLGTSANGVSEITPNRAAGLHGRNSRSVSRTLELKFGADGTNCDVTITDTGGANGGYGSLKLCDLPSGTYFVVRAVVCDVTFTETGAGIDTSNGLKFAIGTAAEAANDTLDSTSANILGSTAATLVSDTVSLTTVTTTAVAVDARSSAAALYLNFGVPTADISASTTVRVTGTIWIMYDAPGANV